MTLKQYEDICVAISCYDDCNDDGNPVVTNAHLEAFQKLYREYYEMQKFCLRNLNV